MLLTLSIRDIVLIDRLAIEFRQGLCVLTGETGAGKSILLDALGLALGGRADAGIVRTGAEQASVVAEFALDDASPLRPLLQELGLEADGSLLLRRVVMAGGRSRAFVNDQPVTVAALRQIGDALVEVHGQHDDRGLLDPSGHRGLLDEFGDLGKALAKCRAAYEAMSQAEDELDRQEAAIAEGRANADYLRHVVRELDELAPEEGEELSLASERKLLRDAEGLGETLGQVSGLLCDNEGVEGRLRHAQRLLERVADRAPEQLQPLLAGLDRAAIEFGEALAALEQASEQLRADPRKLERVEERLFALREAARKHRVGADELPKMLERMRGQLDAVETGEDRLQALREQLQENRRSYDDAAAALSELRRKAGSALEKAVTAELRPLALDKAIFKVAVEPAGRAGGPDGRDRVTFLISTNAGVAPGPLDRVASGGELSRVMLSLKVALARTRSARTLVFDEVDRGVGGAVADRVGERLARLAGETQVLVVTHSPQVAARGGHHWRIVKSEKAKVVRTSVEALDETERQEEIARMLAGAEITAEARAAAARLIAAGRP